MSQTRRREFLQASRPGGGARALRANMTRGGVRPGRDKPAGGDHAHDIDLSTHPHPAAYRARQILDDAGIHSNDGVSGVFVLRTCTIPCTRTAT